MTPTEALMYNLRLYLNETKYIHQLINYKYQKVGGMHFFRLGDFQFSFCITSKWRNK